MADKTVLEIKRLEGGITETSFTPKDDEDYKVAAAGIFTLLNKCEYLKLLLEMLMVASENDQLKNMLEEAIIEPQDFNKLLKNLK